ncbi:MFS transporter [Curtobacterium flaccumfaciens]|uniref:MFS transporter n=1 Tax=Curtobacterium flaccumfaciens TaxID=2035 RepID=UPI001603EC3F|nr:MFS transporter [Curtobacterium flaccumfaciens]MBB1197102.1 MFS transporter [Curtobacterium flaccumfaciens]
MPSQTTVTAPPGRPAAPSTTATRRRVALASFVGTTVEYYDFYLYATASALVFAPTFFPSVTPAVGVIASFATYGVGFVARPLGGVIAGHLGDRIGRKKLLVASLVLMGIASTLIGVIPSAATIGVGAVVALVFLRLLQGVAAGAEWGGSALLSVEHAPERHRGLFGAFTQMGSAGGMLLATGVFTLVRSLLGTEAFLAWGWRLPFLFSAVIVAVGLVIRLGVQDAPVFQELRASGGVERFPVWQAIRQHPRSILVTAGLRLVQPALYSILTTYSLTYLGNVRGPSGSDAGLQAVLVISAVSLVSTPFWGWLSDRVGRRVLTIWSAVGIAVLIWPFFAFLDAGPLVLLPLVALIGMCVFHDSIYGPQAAWFAEQFPTGRRYSGMSLGYQIGSIFSVGLTPLLAAVFVQLGGGSPWILCGYLGVYAVLTIVAAVFAVDPRAVARREARAAAGAGAAGAGGAGAGAAGAAG